MKFQVPQFIEVEDKIFGPLTLKQFIYLIGGGAAIFLLYISLPFFLFILLAIPVGLFAAALAFYKVNNQPFVKFAENAFKHFTKTKTYTWQKQDKPIKKKKEESKKEPELYTPKLTKGKLTDLAWSLDIKKETEHQ